MVNLDVSFDKGSCNFYLNFCSYLLEFEAVPFDSSLRDSRL